MAASMGAATSMSVYGVKTLSLAMNDSSGCNVISLDKFGAIRTRIFYLFDGMSSHIRIELHQHLDGLVCSEFA